MRIGFNLLFLQPWMGGVRVYAESMVRAVIETWNPAEAQLYFFTSPAGERVVREALAKRFGSAERAESVRIIVPPGARGGRLRRLVLEQLGLPLLALRYGVQFLHSFDYTLPYLAPGVRSVTIYDLLYLNREISSIRGAGQIARRILIPLSLRTAEVVVTASDFTRRELGVHFPSATPKVHVVRINQFGASEPAPRGISPVPPKIRSKRYVLAVGTFHPHKNYLRLAEAFAATDLSDLHLALVGRETPYTDRVRDRIAELGVSERVHILGLVTDTELDELYRGAECFVMPSLFEGFGIPVVEAMQRGVPIATSTAGSLPEVAGDAALCFDPEDVNGMAAAISSICTDGAVRARLRQASIRRAAELEKTSPSDALWGMFAAGCRGGFGDV